MRGSHLKVAWVFSHMVLHENVTNYSHYISTNIMPIDTKLGRVVTYSERFLHIKPHNFLMTWPTWDYVTIWKIYIFTFTRLKVTKLDRVLTLGMRFSTQMPKSSPKPFCFLFFLLVAVFGWMLKCFLSTFHQSLRK